MKKFSDTKNSLQTLLAEAMFAVEKNLFKKADSRFEAVLELIVENQRLTMEVIMLAVQAYADMDAWDYAGIWFQRLRVGLQGFADETVLEQVTQDFLQLEQGACIVVSLEDVLIRIKNELESASVRQVVKKVRHSDL